LIRNVLLSGFSARDREAALAPLAPRRARGEAETPEQAEAHVRRKAAQNKESSYFKRIFSHAFPDEVWTISGKRQAKDPVPPPEPLSPSPGPPPPPLLAAAAAAGTAAASPARAPPAMGSPPSARMPRHLWDPRHFSSPDTPAIYVLLLENDMRSVGKSTWGRVYARITEHAEGEGSVFTANNLPL
jgi:hypothetical protein